MPTVVYSDFDGIFEQENSGDIKRQREEEEENSTKKSKILSLLFMPCY